jgi:glycosyltransferase involved in cell wall biosynthesis
MDESINLCVVGPVFNEEAVLEAFHGRLSAVLDRMELVWEILYVEDGSRDRTPQILRDLQAADSRVSVVNLSRNFGKEVATSVGLDLARGQAVVLIDTDLQDPPELIPELYAKFLEGADNVYAQRRSRKGESWFKKASAHLFYRLMQKFSRVPIPVDTGDFRLLSRRAVEALKKLREQHRYMKGLFAWVGYRAVAVPYDRDARFAGTTKWSFVKLFNLAVEGVTSFTTFPLRLASFAGTMTALLAFAYGFWVFGKALLFGDPVAGYPTLMTVILFLGGIQLMALGMIGEYLGRTFDEVKNRPLYLVQEYRATPEEELVRRRGTPKTGSPGS